MIAAYGEKNDDNDLPCLSAPQPVQRVGARIEANLF